MPRSLIHRCAFIILPLLLCGCGDPNEDLVEAAASGDADALAALASEGADPSTALILALQAGRAGAVQPLLDHGADPSSKDSDGTPAVVLAAKLGATESVRVLTARLATPDEIDAEGRTALMWAAENGYPETVRLLVEAGSDVDLEDPNGKTALAVAQEANQTEIAQIFLRICRVGLELSPGESCDVAGAGTVSIRSDGCLGERPGSLATGISVGSLSFTISDGQRITCTAGYFASGAFRITEVPEISRWRIDALP